MDDYERKLYEQAIKKWGIDAQVKMIIEECAELIVKLVKLDRNKNGSTADEVINEIVDVQIMINQAKIIFGEPLVNEWKKTKLGRLAKRLDEDYYKRNDNEVKT